MVAQTFLLCVWMLPSAVFAARTESEDIDLGKASGAVFEEVGSSENSAEDENRVYCRMGYCESCHTCLDCLGTSDTCAWTTDEKVYELVSVNSSLEDFKKLERRIHDFEKENISERLFKGACVENPKKVQEVGDKIGDKLNRYIVATKYVPRHELYTVDDPDFERSSPMVVWTGSDATQTCRKLGDVVAKETANAKKKLKQFERKRQELEQKLEQERERKRLREERKKRDKLTIREILEMCADQASEHPTKEVPKEICVSSSALTQTAMFHGEMQRWAGPSENHKDWQHVLDLRGKVTDGNYIDPVKLSFMKKNKAVFVVAYDGRHRVCAMEAQDVITEVTVNCGSITQEDASKEISIQNTDVNGMNLVNAHGDCIRSKDLYDVWVENERTRQEKEAEERRKAEKERLDRERVRAGGHTGSGQGYSAYSSPGGGPTGFGL